MAVKPELLLALLDRALTEEMGVVITTTNPDYLVNLLGTYSRQLHPDAHANLSIARSSKVDEVFIIRKTTELDP